MGNANNNKSPGWRLFLTALLVGSGGPFHLGYQITITNPSQDVFLAFLEDSFWSHYGIHLTKNEIEVFKYCFSMAIRFQALWSIIIAILFVGGIFGSLTLRMVADRLGRKKGLMVGFAGIALSTVLSIFSKFVRCSPLFLLIIMSFQLLSFEIYALSRFTIGWMISMSSGISGLYLTECSPKKCRGFVSTTTGFFVQIGLVLGSIIALPDIFGTIDLWWLIYLAEFFMLVIVLALVLFIHESPGY